MDDHIDGIMKNVNIHIVYSECGVRPWCLISAKKEFRANSSNARKVYSASREKVLLS